MFYAFILWSLLGSVCTAACLFCRAVSASGISLFLSVIRKNRALNAAHDIAAVLSSQLLFRRHRDRLTCVGIYQSSFRQLLFCLLLTAFLLGGLVPRTATNS